MYTERNGTPRRWTKDILWWTNKTKIGWYKPTTEEMDQQMETSHRPQHEAQENSKPIWKHFTGTKPAKTTVPRKIAKQMKPKKYSNNPMTNLFKRLRKKRSSSRVIQAKKTKNEVNHMISKLYTKLGKKRSTSRAKTILEVEIQEMMTDSGMYQSKHN